MAEKGYYDDMDDREYIIRQYYARFAGKKTLNLENPQTLCEKLNWLKLYNRKSEYASRVDKYAIKKIVSDKIGAEYVIPCLGVWDSFSDIDVSALPKSFVLKCTHDSGSIVVCKDKNIFDIRSAEEKLTKCLNHNHYKENREWTYKNVKPRIIAEPYIDYLDKSDSVEYKITCFNGKVRLITVCIGIVHVTLDERTNDNYDRDFNSLPFYVLYKNSGKENKRPEQLDDMIKFSEVLAKDIPYLRVDWYLTPQGKILFGEVTFYTWAGYMTFTPEKWDLTLGSWVELPNKTEE